MRRARTSCKSPRPCTPRKLSRLTSAPNSRGHHLRLHREREPLPPADQWMRLDASRSGGPEKGSASPARVSDRVAAAWSPIRESSGEQNLLNGSSTDAGLRAGHRWIVARRPRVARRRLNRAVRDQR